MLRKAKNITQSKLAEMCDVSDVYVSRIERGNRFPSLAILYKFSQALGVTLGILMDIDAKENSYKTNEELLQLNAFLNDKKPEEVKVVLEISKAYMTTKDKKL